MQFVDSFLFLFCEISGLFLSDVNGTEIEPELFSLSGSIPGGEVYHTHERNVALQFETDGTVTDEGFVIDFQLRGLS